MRRALPSVALALLVLAGCGPHRPETEEPSISQERIDEAGGVRVLALPRPTEGRLWLSLWVDAGSRAADPPQLATVAAWTLAPGGGGRALADGIELTAACDRDSLGAQLDRWAERLSSREVPAPSVEAALERLRRIRRARASDATRRADALALAALSGGPVDPLGAAEDDARIDPARLRRFLEAHVGSGRVLLVAVGDVEPDELRAEASRAFAGLPAAGERRPSRPLRAEQTLRVEVGDASRVSLATSHPGVSDAARFAGRLLSRISAEPRAPRPSAEAFPLGGRGVALVRLETAEPARVRALVGRAAELLEEEPGEAPPVAPEGDARALAAWYGARWVGGRDEDGRERALALGVVVDGGRGDSTELDADPDAELRRQAEERLGEVLRAARRGPALEGSVDDDRGEVTLANGAVLRGRRERALRRTSVAVLFAGGATEEPASAHGATALLAHLLADRCDAIAQRELGVGLEAIGARARPVLRADAWGLVLEGPAERAPALAALAPRCAGDVPPAAAFEGARSEAVARADAPLASLARALSPDAPGRVAPLGSPATLGRLAPERLRRWASALLRGPRARLAIVGPSPVPPLLRRAARVVSGWPRGGAVERAAWDPPSGVAAGDLREAGARAWIAWTAEASAAERDAGPVVAELLTRGLRRAPGLRVLRSASGHVAGRAWAAVEVACAPAALDGLRARVERAAREDPGSIARDRVARRRASRRWAAATPDALAVREALPAPRADDPREAARRLAAGAPLFLISRPRPGEATAPDGR